MGTPESISRRGWRAVRKLADGCFAVVGRALRIADRLTHRGDRR